MHVRDFLMIPGPTPVPDVVLEACARHPIGHRTKELSEALKTVVTDLKWLGDTKNDVIVLTSSGTGAMEAAIANTVNSGDKVLSLVCGVFGQRWAKIAEAYGAQVERITVEPGQCIDPEVVRTKLKENKDKPFKAVTITHNETSTGVMNDLKTIAALCKEHGVLSIVDAVTSFGAVAIPIDSWGVDVLVTGSQKALMLPPGLAFLFVGERAWQASKECRNPRFYFDLAKYKKSLEDDTTPFTPNVSFIMGMQASMKLFREEGKEKVFQRHQDLQKLLRGNLTAMGLKLFAADAVASPTITSILPPDGVSVADIRRGLKERFRIFVADGQESLQGKIFRIGHMGNVFERDILMTVSALKTVLDDLGYKSK